MRSKLVVLFGVLLVIMFLCSCERSAYTPQYLPKITSPTYEADQVLAPERFTMEVSLYEGSLLLDAPIEASHSGVFPLLKTSQVNFFEDMFKKISNYFTDEDVSVEIGSEKSATLKNGLFASYVFFPNYISIQLGDDGLIQLESWVLPGNAYPGEPYGTRLESVHISEERASELAHKTLFDLEISGMVQVSSQKARVLSITNDTVSEGWYIGFKKESNYQDIDYNFISPFDDSLEYAFSNINAPFTDEMIYMYITENGVRFFRWNDPYIVSEVLSYNTDLASFDRIQDNIQAFFDNRYNRTDMKDEYLPTLKRVVLTSCHVQVDNEPSNSILMPTWMFIFTSDIYEERFFTSFALAFSAIDGERIDPLIIK